MGHTTRKLPLPAGLLTPSHASTIATLAGCVWVGSARQCLSGSLTPSSSTTSPHQKVQLLSCSSFAGSGMKLLGQLNRRPAINSHQTHNQRKKSTCSGHIIKTQQNKRSTEYVLTQSSSPPEMFSNEPRTPNIKEPQTLEKNSRSLRKTQRTAQSPKEDNDKCLNDVQENTNGDISVSEILVP